MCDIDFASLTLSWKNLFVNSQYLFPGSCLDSNITVLSIPQCSGIMVTRWLSAVLPTTAGEIKHRRDLTLFSKSKLEPKISVIHLQLVQEEHDGLGERARWNEEDSRRSGWDETKVTHIQNCQLSFSGENTRGWNFGGSSPRTYSWIQCSVWGNQ